MGKRVLVADVEDDRAPPARRKRILAGDGEDQGDAAAATPLRLWSWAHMFLLSIAMSALGCWALEGLRRTLAQEILIHADFSGIGCPEIAGGHINFALGLMGLPKIR